MRLCAVHAPDAAWAPRLTALLGHKSPVYLGHVQSALAGPLDDLETVFYIGLVGGDPVTEAMVVGAGGAGILGHVFTVPQWRQRGASAALHRVMHADIVSRGYRWLSLGTNPQGHARRIYEGVGFRQVIPGSGTMVWGDLTPPDGPWEVGPARWADWGWVSAAGCATLTAAEPLPRSLLLEVGHQPQHVEGPFIAAMQQRRNIQVLRRGGAAVGWAELSGKAGAILSAVALDLYVRPECATADAAGRLLAALSWPSERPAVCATGSTGYRADALPAAGFRAAAHVPELGGLTLWVRPPN